MVKATEFKIGNKFLSCFERVETVLSIVDNTDKGRIKVCANCPDSTPHFKSDNHRDMYSHLILCWENGNQYKPCEVNGVPLSTQWMEDFGFEKTTRDGEEFWIKDDSFLVFEEEPGKFFAFMAVGEIKIEFVHTLQNMYSLTGKELTLKTPTNEK
jgi:hypothetical protein